MALFTKEYLSHVSIRESGIPSTILRNASVSFSEEKTYDIFLSHSYHDANEIIKIKQIIEDIGFSVYVDWIEDSQLDRGSVNRETTVTLRRRMASCRSLYFVTSESSPQSKWMPWELGYFDGLKHRVAILPVLSEVKKYKAFMENGKVVYIDPSNTYNGQEYLGLYPYVVRDKNTESKEALWIHESENKYIVFDKWLEGKEPYERKQN